MELTGLGARITRRLDDAELSCFVPAKFCFVMYISLSPCFVEVLLTAMLI